VAKTERLKIIEGDIAREIRRKVRLKYIEIPNLVFRVSYVVETSLAKKLDTDVRFVSKLYGDATDLYEELQFKVARACIETDNLGSIMPLKDSELSELDERVKKLFKEYRDKITKVIEDHVNRWLQVRKDRTKYKRSVAWNITTGTVGVVSGVGSFAAGTVTGGLSGILAVVSILKGIYKLAKEIKRIAQDLDKAQRQVQKTMSELVKSYLHSKKWKVGIKELGKHSLHAFFVYEMVSIKRLEKEFVTYKGKVAPLHEKSASLGKSLHKVLDAQTDVDREIEKREKQLRQRRRVSKKLLKLKGNLKENRKQVMKLMDDLSGLDKQLTQHEDFTDKVKETLSELNAKKPGWTKPAHWLISLASIGADPSIQAIVSDGESLEKYADLLKSGYEAIRDEIGG
jgi:CII-binding regulator of phage lambda lysogenization HflD